MHFLFNTVVLYHFIVSFPEEKMKSKCRRRPSKTDMNMTNPPRSTLSYIQDRQYGFKQRSNRALKHHKLIVKELPDYVSQNIPKILTEKELDLGSMNKVFASQWLNDSQVVLGTKCNKLMVIDVGTNDLVNIPTIKSSKDSKPADCPCGIHSIAINPSRTMLATGGQNTNDLAIYDLPTFEPLCVGEVHIHQFFKKIFTHFTLLYFLTLW